MTLRFASRDDASVLLTIYQHYIFTGITFEYVLPGREEFSQRIAAVSAVYPYLILEDQGTALGYAYAHPIAQRAAYAWGAELSIYLHPGAVGKGLGGNIYRALIELLRLQGVRTVYGLVASPNPASEGLHRSLGFNLMGIQTNAGYKNGKWIDLLWFEKAIAPYVSDPAPITPVSSLPADQIQAVLKKPFGN